KGGKLTILQEDQGQLFSIKGTTDGKLKAAQ
ncbi:bacteriophage protein, partial [Salmonella enterica subsp. enterica serovar Bareilly str. 2780]